MAAQQELGLLSERWRGTGCYSPTHFTAHRAHLTVHTNPLKITSGMSFVFPSDYGRLIVT